MTSSSFTLPADGATLAVTAGVAVARLAHMGWTMQVGSIRVDSVIPDEVVAFIKEQLVTLADPAKGIWIHLGNQSDEGAVQVYVTPSTPLMLTRAPNDPAELLRSFERGTTEG